MNLVEHPDILLVGSGIMSANLAALLKRLDPSLRIQVCEAADELAHEASNGWNNAGTGHAGICELSYTPYREPDGSVNVAKALEIFEQFEKSLQFWSHAVASGMIDRPREFINPVPHMSFVTGAEQVDYLAARHRGMASHPFFEEMEFSTDRGTIARWAPLLVDGRGSEPIAATRMEGGTDVNFGEIARKLLGWLERQDGCAIATGCRVTGLRRGLGGWHVEMKDFSTGRPARVRAKFVFVGAGGGSLPLLQTAGIPESRGLGGFPIGGQWLVCRNPDVIARHRAKVYGQALGAAPTMAVPHLDTRILDGSRSLLFGPFAAWTTKFLHRRGSLLDLPRSVRADNLATLLKVGAKNLDLVRYLVQQGTQRMSDRLETLHVFHPAAKAEDWSLVDAGIRVQAIKKTDGEAGIVHYGTEVLTSADRSIAALLGASPGASTSVSIVLDVIRQCFPRLLDGAEGSARMKEMIPTFDIDIKHPSQAAFFRDVHRRAMQTLQLSES